MLMKESDLIKNTVVLNRTDEDEFLDLDSPLEFKQVMKSFTLLNTPQYTLFQLFKIIILRNLIN